MNNSHSAGLSPSLAWKVPAGSQVNRPGVTRAVDRRTFVGYGQRMLRFQVSRTPAGLACHT